MKTHDWYTVLAVGHSEAYKMPPRGPWRGREAASYAVALWHDLVGDNSDTIWAAHSARFAGPFCTREAAKDADISDYAGKLCHCENHA